MKQYITTEQLAELLPEQHVTWRKWLEDHRMFGQTHLMSNIGQMIEFLKERAMGDLDLQIWINNAGSSVWTGIGEPEDKLGGGEDIELCDGLWEAVKDNLEAESE